MNLHVPLFTIRESFRNSAEFTGESRSRTNRRSIRCLSDRLSLLSIPQAASLTLLLLITSPSVVFGQDSQTSAQQAAQSAQQAEKASKEAEKAATEALKASQKASEAAGIAPQSALGSEPTICGQPVVERTDTYDSSWRPQAGADYVVLGYDVQKHALRWFDYKHQAANPILVGRNGSFVPVVYSREKVLVHVCGLHPTDTVSISTNDVSVPEEGADIRGTTPSTAVALAPTLDTLGSANAAGVAFGPAGISFGSPPGVTALQTSLFTAGSSKDGTTYSDAMINIAPEDLALETLALYFNAQDALATIDELAVGFKLQQNQTPQSIPACAGKEPPGTICELTTFATQLESDLGGPEQPQFYDGYKNEGSNSLGAFNDYLARTQTLVSQMNGLAAGVGQAGLPGRAVALRQNLEAILGVFEQVDHLINDDENMKSNPVFDPVDASKKPPTPPQLAYFNKSKPGEPPIYVPATCDNLETTIADGATLYTDNTGKQAYSPADTVTCHAAELYTMRAFEDRFQLTLKNYNQITQKVEAALEAEVGELCKRQDAAKLYPECAKLQLLAAANNFNDLFSELISSDNKLVSQAKIVGNKMLQTDSVETKQDLAAFHVRLNDTAALAESINRLFPVSRSKSNGSQQSSGTPMQIFSIDSTTDKLSDLFIKILALRVRLGALDSTVGDIFAKMNDRYDRTYVEQTDDLPPLTSNTTVRIGINVQRNYTPFTLSGGATIGAASGASSTSSAPSAASNQATGAAGAGKASQLGGSPSGGSTSSATSSGGAGSNDITVMMEVHRLANFNLVGGAMAIFVPTLSISAVPKYAVYGSPSVSTTTSGMTTTTTYTYSAMGSCNGGAQMLVSTTSNTTNVTPPPALYYCYQSSQTSSWQPAGMAGVEWFLFGGRDYFSRDRGNRFRKKNWVPSLLVASSVTSLGSMFFGPNLEPVNGFDVFGGYASAHQSSLPTKASLYTVYPPGSNGNPPTLGTNTHLKWGGTVGVGFDLSVFLQLFSKTQGPSLP